MGVLARGLTFLALVLLVFNEVVSSNRNGSEDQSCWDCNVDDDGVMAEQIPGLRPGSFRYHIRDGFFFHRQRAASGRVFLRCVNYRSNPACLVRAVMNLDLSGFIITGGQHNHGPDLNHEAVQQLRSNIFQACRARPYVRVDVIYHDVCRNVPRDVSSRVSLLSIRPSMIRVQGENRPNIPQSFEELDQLLLHHEELSRTVDAEADLYRGMVREAGHRSLLFMSARILDGAGDIRHIFGDATFYARPNVPESSQLYTLITIRDNHVLPLGYALMESRTGTAYRNLFQFIRQIAPRLDPDFIMTDFELAQQNTFLEVFLRARLTGCLWHYSRTVCRKVRTLGLHPQVRDNANARRILRLSLAIPLAPPDRIQEALNVVVIESRRLNLHDTFVDFFRYIRATWVVGVGSRVLSVFGVRHRTNNAAECHHRNINSRVVRRPNIWRFVEVLRELEDTAWRDLGRLEQGLAPSRARRSTSLLNDARIRSCSRQVMNQEMDLLHFLASVSWHLENTMNDLLRERDDDARPNSPDRGPPNIISDDIRVAQISGLVSGRGRRGRGRRPFSRGGRRLSPGNNSGRGRPSATSQPRRPPPARSSSPRPSASPRPLALSPQPARENPLRNENFSDAEDVPEANEQGSQQDPEYNRWAECIICSA